MAKGTISQYPHNNSISGTTGVYPVTTSAGSWIPTSALNNAYTSAIGTGGLGSPIRSGGWQTITLEALKDSLIRAIDSEVHPSDPKGINNREGYLHHPTHLWVILNWDIEYPTHDTFNLRKKMLGYWVARAASNNGNNYNALGINNRSILNDPIGDAKVAAQFWEIHNRIAADEQRALLSRTQADMQNHLAQKMYGNLLSSSNSSPLTGTDSTFWGRIISGLGIK